MRSWQYPDIYYDGNKITSTGDPAATINGMNPKSAYGNASNNLIYTYNTGSQTTFTEINDYNTYCSSYSHVDGDNINAVELIYVVQTVKTNIFETVPNTSPYVTTSPKCDL